MKLIIAAALALGMAGAAPAQDVEKEANPPKSYPPCSATRKDECVSLAPGAKAKPVKVALKVPPKDIKLAKADKTK